MENKEDGARVVRLELLLDVGLVLGKELRMKLDVAWLVDTMHVAECGSDGEHRGDGREGAVDVPNVFWLGVEGVVVNRLVVDTVLFTTGDANFHLEPAVDLGHALEVFSANLDVFFLGLFGQIKHMRGEERLAVLFEVGLVGVEHAVEPRKKLVGAVVGVYDDRDAIGRSNSTNVVGSSDGASDGGELGLGWVLDALASPEGSTALGDLEDDRGLGFACTFKGSDSGGRRGNVLHA